MAEEGEKAAVFRTTKVRAKLKGDNSWLQQQSGSQTESRDGKVMARLKGDSSWLQRNDPQAAAEEQEKPWMAEIRNCRENGDGTLSSPVSSPTKSTQPLTTSEAERTPTSGFLIRGIFTKLDSTSSSPPNSLSGSTQTIKKPSESYKKIAPHTVKPSVGNQETQLSEQEQEKRREAASSVLKQSAARQRSYVLSAAKKFESQQDASEAPLDKNHQSFVATRVEIIDDESTGAATPVASTPQPQPKKRVRTALMDQELAAAKKEAGPEPVKEAPPLVPVAQKEPVEHLKPGCTKVDTPLPELNLECVQSADKGTKPKDSLRPGQTDGALVELAPAVPARKPRAAAPPPPPAASAEPESPAPESPPPSSPIPETTAPPSVTPQSPVPVSVNTVCPAPPSPAPESPPPVSNFAESASPGSPLPETQAAVSNASESLMLESPALVSISPESPPSTSPVPESTTLVSITPESPPSTSPVPESTTLVSISPESPPSTSPVPESTTLVSITPESPPSTSPVTESTTLVSITQESPPSNSTVPESTTLVSITQESPPSNSTVPESTTLVSITPKSPPSTSPVPESTTLVSIAPETPPSTSPAPESTTLVSITPETPPSTSSAPESTTLVSIIQESPPSTTDSQAAASFVPVPPASAVTEITERTELQPSLNLSSRDGTLAALSDTLISFDTSSSSFKNDEPAPVEREASPAEKHADHKRAEETPTPELSNCVPVTDDLLAFTSGPEEPPGPVPPSPGRWSQDLFGSLGGEPGETSSTMDLLANDVIFTSREAPGLNVEPVGEIQAAEGTQSSTETVTTTTKTVIIIDRGGRKDPEPWSSNVKTTVVETSLADPFDPYPIGTTASTSSADPLQPDADISINSTSTTATEVLAEDINTDTTRLSTRRSWARTWETSTTEQSPDAEAEDGDQKMFVMFERKSSENDSPWDRWTSPTVYTTTTAEEEEEEEEERPGDTQTETATTISTISYGTYSRTMIEEDQRVQTPPPEAKKPFVYVKEYINTTASSLHNISSSGSSTCTYCGELVGNDAKITIEHLNVNSHPHCFKCAVCWKPMGDLLDSMFIHGGEVNCESCYSRAFD